MNHGRMKNGNMKKYVYMMALALGAVSCGDVPDNGDLDGLWHLRTVETLEDNQVEDVKATRIYYAIQQRLITVKHESLGQYVGRFVHTGDSLILHQFVVYQREDEEATAEELLPFGLEGTESRYAVRQLHADRMVLRSANKELTFKKF